VGPQKILGKTLRKIIKIVATMQMTDFKAKMHQIRFRLGLRPDPAGGAYSAPPDPLAGFGGRFAAGEELGWERGGKGEGKRREGKWRGGKGRAPSYC